MQFAKLTIGLLIAGGMSLHGHSYAQDENTKSLFYDLAQYWDSWMGDDEEDTAENMEESNEKLNTDIANQENTDDAIDEAPVGIVYWIELLDAKSKQVSRVSNDRVFNSGQLIRLHITANADGVVHVMHKGSSGANMIVPVSSGGLVLGGKEITVPADDSWLEFDENKGVEELEIVYSPQALAKDLGLAIDSDTSQSDQELLANLKDVYGRYSTSKNLQRYVESGTKDLRIVSIKNDSDQADTEDAAVNKQEIAAEDKPGDNTLVVVADEFDAPGNYTVNVAGEPVALTIALNHQ